MFLFFSILLLVVLLLLSFYLLLVAFSVEFSREVFRMICFLSPRPQEELIDLYGAPELSEELARS